MDNSQFRRCAVAMVLAWLILPGSAGAKENPDVALQELLQMFPGHWDNTAQVQASRTAGATANSIQTCSKA